MKAALIAFAKTPRAGSVKTRLTPLLHPDDAAMLYTAFVQDALAQYRDLDGVDVRLYVAPPDPFPESLLPEGITLHPQSGADLGERMLLAFLETFKAGYERIVIVGTDHPTLPATFIEMAFDTLWERYNVVLGPSEDGGFYLLGMNEFYPALFEGMAYSHPDVFNQTVIRAGFTPADLNLLPMWYDVDDEASLRKLIEEIPHSDEKIAYTRAAIANLLHQYPSLQCA